MSADRLNGVIIMKLVKSSTPEGAGGRVKPQPVELGQISDVAGNATVNANGLGNNQKS